MTEQTITNAAEVAPTTGAAIEPAPEVVTGEIVSEEEFQQAVRRNRFAGARLALREAARSPETRETVGKAGGLVLRGTGQTLSDTGRGAELLLNRWMNWLTVANLRPGERRDKMPLPQYTGQVAESMKRRGIISGVAALGSGGAVTADLLATSSHPVTWGAAGAIAFSCWLRGLVTRRRDTREAAKVLGQFVRPSKDGLPDEAALTKVFQDAGVLTAPRCNAAGEVTKPGQALRLIERHFQGHYYELTVELPAGVTAGQAIKRHENLASALGSSTICVWLAPVREHTARLKLTVFSDDPFGGGPIDSPLAGAKRASVWDDNPVGVDVYGGLVPLNLLESSLLIASMPGYGKTNLIRVVTTPALLDPTCRIALFDGKPDNIDTEALAQVAEVFEQGNTEEVAYKLLDYLDQVYAEGMDRFRRFRRLGRHRVPKGKLTRELHEDTSEELRDLAVLYIVIDECHIFLGCSAPGPRQTKHGKDATVGQLIAEVLVDIIKTPGRAGGIVPILATQDVASTGIPAELRKVLGSRAAFYVDTYAESNQVLGQGKYEAGWDASDTETMQPGVAILRRAREGAEAMIKTKTHFIDAEAFWATAERGRDLREQAGTLRGAAVDWTPDADWDTEPAEVEPVPVAAEITDSVLAATVAYVEECAAGGDDRALIPSVELYDEVIVSGRAGREMTATAYGRELSKMGIRKDTEPGRGGRIGRQTADVLAAAERVRNGGPLYVAEDVDDLAA